MQIQSPDLSASHYQNLNYENFSAAKICIYIERRKQFLKKITTSNLIHIYKV